MSTAASDLSTVLPGNSDLLRVRSARDRIRKVSNLGWTIICVGLSFLTLVPLFSIIYMVVQNGTAMLNPNLFTQTTREGGLGNALQGSAVLVGLAMLASTPLGVLSAIYICEYEPRSRLSKTVRFVAKLLTGIPSIICGMFAYAQIVLTTGDFSSFAGGIALAVLTLPTILLTSEQALLSVPRSLREASYGMGATKFQTIFRVVLPEALPGIMTGIMLAVARAAGETAPILFSASFSGAWMQGLKGSIASLPVFIYNNYSDLSDTNVSLAWTASLVLVVIVTVANILAQVLFAKRKVKKRA